MNAKIHYSIIDNEAGNIIEHAETLEQAQQIIAEYESADKKDGTYTPNFYQIARKTSPFMAVRMSKCELRFTLFLYRPFIFLIFSSLS